MIIEADDGGLVKVLDEDRTRWRFSENALCRCVRTNGERRMIATCRIGNGVRIFRERAYATALTKETDDLCSWCFKPMTEPRWCEDCPASYCSEHCQQKDAGHPCSALAVLANLENEAADIDVAALRLTARFAETNLDGLCDHYDDLRRDAANGDDAAEDALRTAFMSAAVLQHALGTENDLLRTVLKVRFNAYPFANGAGLALFLDASAFNHSCRSDVALSIEPDGSGAVQLEARVMGDATQDHELTVSYLGFRALLSPCSARREGLRLAFRFDCRCVRCCEDVNDDSSLVADLDSLSEILLNAATSSDNAHDVTDIVDAVHRFDTVLSSLPDLGAAMYASRSDLRILAARAIAVSAAKSPTRPPPAVLDTALAQASLAFDDARLALGPRHPRSLYAKTFITRLERLRS